jgi:hypothetical protein
LRLKPPCPPCLEEALRRVTLATIERSSSGKFIRKHLNKNQKPSKENPGFFPAPGNKKPEKIPGKKNRRKKILPKISPPRKNR